MLLGDYARLCFLVIANLHGVRQRLGLSSVTHRLAKVTHLSLLFALLAKKQSLFPVGTFTETRTFNSAV